MNTLVYLDNNATTKIDQRVFHKQCFVLNKYFGNPSSLYPVGVEAKNIISDARKKIASLINADLKNGDQVVFNSCATEGNNSVLHSVLHENTKQKHVIVSAVEHPSILSTVEFYEKKGCQVTYIGVNNDGTLKEKELFSSITENTALISIMHVNSETGVVFNIQELTQKIKKINNNILVHTDAVQAVGKIAIDVQKLGVDFLTLSGHKFHAPKGVGVLYIRAGIKLNPLLLGGHQEHNLRAGTENVASIAAIGEAAVIAENRIYNNDIKQIEILRNKMEGLLSENFPESIIYGKQAQRVATTTNIGFRNINGDKLLLQLAKYNICVSSGTACNSINSEPSKVLISMGAPKDYIRSIRISMSYETSEDDVFLLIKALKEILKKEGKI